eukprot:3007747-Rhodomonas_salina.1
MRYEKPGVPRAISPTEDWPRSQAAESDEESTPHLGSSFFLFPPVPGEEEEKRGGEAAPSHRSSRIPVRLNAPLAPPAVVHALRSEGSPRGHLLRAAHRLAACTARGCVRA